jgi:ubiquinone biosynthesis protein
VPLVRKAADVAMGGAQVVRDLGRLRQIVQVLAGHGLAWIVERVEVPGVGILRSLAGDSEHKQPTPERVCAVFNDLGPTFVKLGQVLSTRDDLIPAAYVEAFQTLQMAVDPVPWEQISAVVQACLNGTPEQLFDEFEQEPLAAASIAQVHRARLKTGELVAVKVQRPGIRKKIQTDLSILEFLARQVAVQVPETALIDPVGTVRVLRQSLSEETDFRHEARNIEQFAENFRDIPWVKIPEVYKAFLGADVLTMEFIDGSPMAQARDAGYDMRLVGDRYLQAAFKMLLEDGHFHGDLHPGNVFVLPGERLALLDFGMVGRLSPENKQDLVDIFFALNRRDARTIARIYWELAIKPERVDYGAWESDVQELMEHQFFGKAMAEIQVADFIRELMERANKHGVRATSAYTMFFKALITTEGLAKMLIPEVDPLEAMKPYVQKMVARQYSADRLREELFFWLTSFRYSGRRLPLVIGQLVSELQDGTLRLRTWSEESPEDRQRADDRTNRLALAIVSGAFFVGSSLALSAEVPRVLGLPWPAFVGYVLASAAAARLLNALRGR